MTWPDCTENNLAATHRSLWLGSRPRPATGLFFLPTTPMMVIDWWAKIDARAEVHWRTVILRRAVISRRVNRICRRGLIHIEVDFPGNAIFRREPAASPEDGGLNE